MITLPSLDALPAKWNEIRELLETDFSADLEALMHERFTEHEAKQFEQDFIDCIGCALRNMSVSAELSYCWKLVILIVQTN